MGLIWLILILAVVALLWLFARAAGGGLGGRSRHETPEEILKRRYAAGEIDREEYESKLFDLRR